MFKTVVTLFRGSVAAAGEELEDRTALLILDQQMRDAAAAHERSKRTLALAIAQDQQEGRKLEATCTRIADLEIRAVAALDGGREDLAKEAAEAIAGLEADRHAAEATESLIPRSLRSGVVTALPVRPATEGQELTNSAGQDGWARRGSNPRPTDYESAALTG